MLYRTKPLSAIRRMKGPAAPGVAAIYYIPVERVASDPPIVIRRSIFSVLPGVTAPFTEGKLLSPEYRQDFVADDAGGAYEVTLSAFVAFDDDTNAELLQEMVGHKFIVIIKLQSGSQRYIGSKENPVALKFDYNSGRRNAASSPGHAISFTWRNYLAPLIFQGRIPEGLIIR